MKNIIPQLSKFIVVGVMNTGIDFAVFNFLIFVYGITAGIGISIITAIAFIAANVNSYFFNKRWTFKDHSEDAQETAVKFSTFFIVSIGGLILNSAVVYILTTLYPPFFGMSSITLLGMDNATLWANFAKVVAIGLSLVWNFIGYKYFVFQK